MEARSSILLDIHTSWLEEEEVFFAAGEGVRWRFRDMNRYWSLSGLVEAWRVGIFGEGQVGQLLPSME